MIWEVKHFEMCFYYGTPTHDTANYWGSFKSCLFYKGSLARLMDRNLRSPPQVGSLNHYLQDFTYPRWLFEISSIDSGMFVFALIPSRERSHMPPWERRKIINSNVPNERGNVIVPKKIDFDLTLTGITWAWHAYLNLVVFLRWFWNRNWKRNDQKQYAVLSCYY